MKRKRLLRKAALTALKAVAACYGFWIGSLVLFRWVTPPTTGVQIQRRVESWFRPGKYEKRFEPVALSRISPQLQHAVIAAEDGRFYAHWGIDAGAMVDAAKDSAQKGRRLRGASTITQQLIKNLYFTTHSNPLRKVIEWTLAPVAELILGKQRILELYLNVIEWGPGVWGAEAAARYHYRTSAHALQREQAQRLAACIPAPRRRRPALMGEYAGIIETRMQQLGY